MRMNTLPKIWTAVAVGFSTLLTSYLCLGSWKAHASLAETARRPQAVSREIVPIMSIEELYANVSSQKDGRAHLMALKLDIELFDEKARDRVTKSQGVIRNAILMTAFEQDYDWLSSMPGKLFFKEHLVTRINEAFNGAVVRDVHFSSFYLR